ncbi:hypothetical protein [Varibaculum cambriense]|uniref:hypothetical protein n=1 Tax=Varibaculum cambriense TaxID=184870 RepID=UPI00241D2411|nr:hypothetical protein [Varibaculum cambriense]MBS5945034.1 hypothetical protein [Varibaculum cambriense]
MYYTTKKDFIDYEILPAIENGVTTRDKYDIDAIADAVSDVDERGRYYQKVDADEFWEIVAANEI